MTAQVPLHPLWAELFAFVGTDAIRWDWCNNLDAKIPEERRRYATTEQFYAESDILLYHLTANWLCGIRRPWLGALLRYTGAQWPPPTLLDYGCGTGQDGIWLDEAGYTVAFADFPGRLLDYLRWRRAMRQMPAPLYVLPIDAARIPRHDIVWCMDVLEHQPDPQAQDALLGQLAQFGTTVFVNIITDAEADGVIHHPVDRRRVEDYLRTQYHVLAVETCYQMANGTEIAYAVYQQRG